MQKVAVVIPIFKVKLNESEYLSLMQCITTLGSHPIIFIAPNSLDISFYENACKDTSPKKTERFNDIYFKDVKGYNKLMLSVDFYKRFSYYEYILIYQTDAWVFRDDLLFWCKKNYDYIGSPWFKDWHNAIPGAESIGIGNGGFSLRKVSSILRALHSFAYIKKPLEVWREFIEHKSFTSFWKMIMDLTIRNNSFYLFNDYKKNEDRFWFFIISKNFKWFNIPSVEDALRFSIETNPSYYIKNATDLPFGCHAWERYEPEFWKKYIK